MTELVEKGDGLKFGNELDKPMIIIESTVPSQEDALPDFGSLHISDNCEPIAVPTDKRHSVIAPIGWVVGNTLDY
jgi:hypothetical protein